MIPIWVRKPRPALSGMTSDRFGDLRRPVFVAEEEQIQAPGDLDDHEQLPHRLGHQGQAESRQRHQDQIAHHDAQTGRHGGAEAGTQGAGHDGDDAGARHGDGDRIKQRNRAGNCAAGSCARLAELPVPDFEDLRPRLLRTGKDRCRSSRPGRREPAISSNRAARRTASRWAAISSSSSSGARPSRARDNSRASASMMEISSAFCSPVEQSRASARFCGVAHGQIGQMRADQGAAASASRMRAARQARRAALRRRRKSSPVSASEAAGKAPACRARPARG